MKNKEVIYRKLVGGTMLCILTVCITPVAVFHHFISSHEDVTIQHRHTHDYEFANAGFNCHNESFVAVENFSPVIAAVIPEPPHTPCGFIHVPFPAFFSQPHMYAELRGPPSVSL